MIYINRKINQIFIICIILWLYAIGFLQYANLNNISISFVILLFYTLLYSGVKLRIFPSIFGNLISFTAFNLTFTEFWVNIINFVLLYANLLGKENLYVYIFNGVIYAIFFVLFYSTLDKIETKDAAEEPYTALKSVIRLSFPIIIFAVIFLITLFLNSLYQQLTLNPANSGSSEINILINNLAMTITFTSTLTYLIEKWLNTANNTSLQQILFAESILGLLLTLLLVFSKTR